MDWAVSVTSKLAYICNVLDSCKSYPQRVTVLDWVDDLLSRGALTIGEVKAIKLYYRTLRRKKVTSN